MSNANSSRQFFEDALRRRFQNFCSTLFANLNECEHARIALRAENTHFLRFNKGLARQNGVIENAYLNVQLLTDAGASTVVAVQFVPTDDGAPPLVKQVLEKARRQIDGVPADPYANKPSAASTSRTVHEGKLLPATEAIEAILGSLPRNTDFVGIYAAGPTISALADSAGMNHWFAAESFFVDYSLWLSNGRAIKSGYAGREWNQQAFRASVAEAQRNLEILQRPQKTLRPGSYRAFLAPSATADLLEMFSWGAISEGSIQRKDSPLCAVRSGEKHFSPLFSLKENFNLGFAPRFTEDGELAPEEILLFDEGRFVQALVGARTQKEFGVGSNGAGSERLRSTEMATGSLPMSDAFRAIGTGLYLSNLHYLNWSDVNSGRVTGMTRYGCLWVEDGEAVCPIQDLRFDDTIFRTFGSELESVTRESVIIPDTSTYENRALGAIRTPGIMLRSLNFTL
jgi:predicted Zn-dependent protease